ncbi:MAG: hypothetical protein QOE36_3521, partial [Gaiellaceae bacterium]|nr:hypothetical protein [Gaiellaceae bacterium]
MRRLLTAAAAALALAAPTAARAATPSGWLTYGGGSARTSSTGPVATAALAGGWTLPLDGRVVGQPLAVRDVPAAGALTVYAATSGGGVYAVAPNGYVRWRVDLGQLALASPCPQMDGWGVTGTPVADPASGALYVADAFGRLHALDLADGTELAGWPVRIFAGYTREQVWGALTLVRGSVYVPTASICDRPVEGELVRVALASRAVSRWIAVPRRLGGGGGIWGFGGAAYSRSRNSLFVATGNAFGGGERHESAGYGEQLVELSPELRVRAASHPRDVREPRDL